MGRSLTSLTSPPSGDIPAVSTRSAPPSGDNAVYPALCKTAAGETFRRVLSTWTSSNPRVVATTAERAGGVRVDVPRLLRQFQRRARDVREISDTTFRIF